MVAGLEMASLSVSTKYAESTLQRKGGRRKEGERERGDFIPQIGQPGMFRNALCDIKTLSVNSANPQPRIAGHSRDLGAHNPPQPGLERLPGTQCG